MEYEITEYGKRITPYLLKHTREQPCWKIVEEVMTQVIFEHDLEDFMVSTFSNSKRMEMNS